MRHARISIPGGCVVGIDADARGWRLGDQRLDAQALSWAPVATERVYGVALNHRDELNAGAGVFADPPYRGLPRAAVLYVKPVNTHAAHGCEVALPAGANEVEVGGTLGVIIGATATRLTERSALEAVRGYTVAADLTLAGAGLHRPPIRESCFDGACPTGPWWVDAADLGDPTRLEVAVSVNGVQRQRWRLDRLARPIPSLLAHITGFMTLDAGDIVLAGLAPGRPRARPGDAVSVTIEPIGRLDCRIAEAGR
jgi:5-oxopent-3-ene-1,2,5-tricarboxylate decarboxylase/2-hydroxyhepta-2,4-diene-1,7-dioate isomerase